MSETARHYAFPYAGADERRRLELFAERLDPLTMRRIKALDLAPGARCLEIGAGRGSIARWLCEYAGPTGRVTATGLPGLRFRLHRRLGTSPDCVALIGRPAQGEEIADCRRAA